VKDFIGRALLFVLILIAGCNGSSSPTPTPTPSPSPAPTPVPTPVAANFLPITVNSSPFGLINVPTASVTVCQPGTSNCQTINGVLIDTGSVGLRIFSSALAVPLRQQEVNGEPTGECFVFAGGPSWGPVGFADLQMGNEPKISSIPVQIIADSNFAPEPADCAIQSVLPPLTNPAAAGFNAVLGVGLFPQDCEAVPNICQSGPTTQYYSCTSASPSGACTPAAQALGDQVPNPVTQLPVDNNGVVVELQQLLPGGSPSASGFLLFGIGTEPDNQIGSATVLTLNGFLSLNVTYKGAILPDSFIDSGSNGFFFRDSSIRACSNANIYCPSSPVKLSAVATGQNGNNSTINFEIATPLSPNFAFNDFGANNNSFDEFTLGLSFFFGRSVFVAIQGAGTPAGPGPYWAF
jgi:Protein of unknown function (DUF3443)